MITQWTPNVQERQKELADLQAEVEEFVSLVQRLSDLSEMIPIIETDKEQTEMTILLEAIEEDVKTKERELRFSGAHDRTDAIITIQAGAGGTDAQDWAEMLERMYLRFAERKGWQTSLLNRSLGEEAGIKHSTFIVRGRYAYGILRGEHGVHRLVRQSPFNADKLRQTSFARVEIIPQLPEKELPPIDTKDLQIDTFRASGAGGQHVNKTSSAVRITHLPTGLVVECQNERSQGQNKAQAMKMLQSKLQMLLEEQQTEKMEELRGEIREAAWGNQIRSYVLHPYKLVKDKRTGVEVSDVESILDGQLDPLLDVV